MPAWLVSIILSLGIGIVKPLLIKLLQQVEVNNPVVKPLIDEVITFLTALQKDSEAKPSEALIAAADAHKQSCEGVACVNELKKD